MSWQQEWFEIDEPEPELEMFADEEYEDEHEHEYEYEADDEDELEWEAEGPFDEDQELELAAELLTVSDDAELEQFLGKVFRRVGRAGRRLLRSSTGHTLKGLLRGAAKKALPIVGRAVGRRFGGARGGDVGARLASLGGKVFGLELEGLSPEDQELEMARRFVRLAGDAAKTAAGAPSRAPSRQVAGKALAAAARRHAPGLLRGGRATADRSGQSGRWVRRGRTIILLGA